MSLTKKIKNLKRQKRRAVPTREIHEEPEVKENALAIRRLQAEYEQETKTNALTTDGKPTEQYLEWKSWRSKFEYLSLQSDLKLKKDQKQMRVQKIAFKISQLWSAQKIQMAIKNDGGFEIHGWMQNHFEDYEELIDEYVLDKALTFSKRDFKPEIIKELELLDFNTLKITHLNLRKAIEFKDYEGLVFNQVMLLTNDYMEKALTWIKNYDYEIDEFETKVTYAPANMGLTGFCDWNLPVVIVLHAPGKNQALFNARVDAKALADTLSDIWYKMLHQLQTSVEPLQIKADKFERGKLQLQRELEVWKQEIMKRAPRDIVERSREIERSAYGDKKTKWQNIAIIVLIIVVIALLFGFFSWFNPTGG